MQRQVKKQNVIDTCTQRLRGCQKHNTGDKTQTDPKPAQGGTGAVTRGTAGWCPRLESVTAAQGMRQRPR